MMHHTKYSSQKCMPITECEAENMISGYMNRNINILPVRLQLKQLTITISGAYILGYIAM